MLSPSPSTLIRDLQYLICVNSPQLSNFASSCQRSAVWIVDSSLRLCVHRLWLFPRIPPSNQGWQNVIQETSLQYCKNQLWELFLERECDLVFCNVSKERSWIDWSEIQLGKNSLRKISKEWHNRSNCRIKAVYWAIPKKRVRVREARKTSLN